MRRLAVLEKYIELSEHSSGHLIVTSKVPGFRFKRLTSITSGLNKTELHCVRCKVYQIISENSMRRCLAHVRDEVANLNYSDCFGSRWLIKECVCDEPRCYQSKVN